jgi:hypothetical protein
MMGLLDPVDHRAAYDRRPPDSYVRIRQNNLAVLLTRCLVFSFLFFDVPMTSLVLLANTQTRRSRQ